MRMNVVIVGLGNIGMCYDLKSNDITSHAKAFSLHKNFYLSAGVDLNKKKRFLFEKNYLRPAYKNLTICLKKTRPDIVVISTPAKNHLKIIIKIFKNYSPNVIICEKPLGINFKESLKIDSLCKKFKTKLFVNYVRLSDPGIIKIKKKIQSGFIQNTKIGVVFYSKGMLNNASHFLNTLQYWFGDIVNIKLIERGKKINNCDFEHSFKVHFHKVEVYFFPCSDSESFANSIQLNAKNGSLFYGLGGKYILWQKKIKFTLDPSKYNVNYQKLFTGKNNSQMHFVNNLYLVLKNKKHNICYNSTALKTLEKIHSLND